MFTLTINTDNEAFEDDGRDIETARLLADIATQVETGYNSGHVYDYNGNNVGEWTFTD